MFVPGPMKKISKFYYTVRISFTDEMQYGICDGSAANPGYKFIMTHDIHIIVTC